MSRKSRLLIAAAVISIPAITSSNAIARPAAAHGVVSTPHVSTLGASRVAVPQAKFKKNALGSVDANTPAAGRSAAQIKAFLAQRKAAEDAAKASSGGPYGQALEKAKQIGEAAGKTASGNTSTSSGGPFGQAVDKAKKIGEDAAKTANGSASASSGGPFGQAVDKAKKIGEDAAKTANGSASASSGGPFGQAVDKAKKIGEDAAKAAQAAAEAKAKLQSPVGKVGSQIPAPPPPPPPPPPPTPKGTPDGGYRPHFPAPGGVVVFGSGVSIDPVVVQPGPIVAGSTATGRTATTSRVAGAVTDGATTPRPNPCNCLVKERLADGSVLFVDICTKESARSVPTNETATPRDAQ
jgi:hypothetical protein